MEGSGLCENTHKVSDLHSYVDDLQAGGVPEQFQGWIASVNLKLLMHLILVDFSPIIHSRPPFEVVANMGRAHGFNVDIDFVSKKFCQTFTSLPAGSSGSAL